MIKMCAYDFSNVFLFMYVICEALVYLVRDRELAGYGPYSSFDRASVETMKKKIPARRISLQEKVAEKLEEKANALFVFRSHKRKLSHVYPAESCFWLIGATIEVLEESFYSTKNHDAFITEHQLVNF